MSQGPIIQKLSPTGHFVRCIVANTKQHCRDSLKRDNSEEKMYHKYLTYASVSMVLKS